MITVTTDNFVRAESNRMLVGLQAQAGGTNRWRHLREPTALDEQTVIRMNRDTLYSTAVVNISEGATLTVPDAGGRYLSVMVVNQDHYINRIFTQAGDYTLTVEEFDTPYVLLAARVLVDPDDPDDIAQVHQIQDRFSLTATADAPLQLPDYDEQSFTAIRQSLLDEVQQTQGIRSMFAVARVAARTVKAERNVGSSPVCEAVSEVRALQGAVFACRHQNRPPRRSLNRMSWRVGLADGRRLVHVWLGGRIASEHSIRTLAT